MNYPAEKKFYIDQIRNNFLPYWSKFVDPENGGILNCINNYGDKKISDNKFTWSQGRWLWILCRLSESAKKKDNTEYRCGGARSVGGRYMEFY